MDCARAREILWPADHPRLAEDDVVEARRHVEECQSCDRALAYDGALSAVFARLREEDIPVRVRERVYNTLARARARAGGERGGSRALGGRRPRPGTAVFGTLALGVVAAMALYWSLTPESLAGPGSGWREAEAFIEDYVRRAVRQDHVTTSDPSVVIRFLARELGRTVGLVEVAGFEIEGAEVCLLEGRRGAMVVYRRGGQVLSYYVLPTLGGSPRTPVIQTPGPPVDEAGASVVTWATPDADYALVGDVSAEELLRAARGAPGGGAGLQSQH